MQTLLPSQLKVLDNDQVAVTGATARQVLGARGIHLQPECVVTISEQELLHLTAKPSSDASGASTYELDGWTVRLAETDLNTFLANRRVALDAMAVHPDGTLIDPLGGARFLASQRLSMPSASVEPCDGLRLLAIASEQGWELNDEERHWIGETADRSLNMARSEIRQSLEHLLIGFSPARALTELRLTGLLAFLLPEVHALIDFHKSSKHHHKDIWDHTRIVVRQAIPYPTIRWAALLHDIGKVHTRSYSGRGKVHFLKHDEVGAYMFEGIAHRLNFPAEQADRIRLLILHHLRPGLYDGKWSDAAIRRFGEKMGPIIPDLFALSRADVTSKRPGNRRRALFNLNDLRKRLDALQAADRIPKPVVPRGLGRRIIDDLGITPGPRVGELRKYCVEAIQNGELPNDAALDVYLEYLREHLAA